MRVLPPALCALAQRPQFILYEKATKTPIDPWTLRKFPNSGRWQTDPSMWATVDHCCAAASANQHLGVGFLLTPEDPFFLLDIDGAWNGEGWSPLAVDLCNRFAGAAIEVSSSGRGLHIIGTGVPPEHSCKNTDLHIELYTAHRYIALTGTGAVGDAGSDHTVALWAVADELFKPREVSAGGWTDGPVDGYTCTDDDSALLARAFASKGAGATFGGGVSLIDLYLADETALARRYPSGSGDVYDRSSADAALAQHLAFWTGGDCERILRIMRDSALVRDKWDREDYLYGTIERAVSLQKQYYSVGPKAPEGLPPIKGPSSTQNALAERVRATVLASASPDQIEALSGATNPSFWIESGGKTADELVAAITPISSPTPQADGLAPVVKGGYQYMPVDMQLEHFKGLVYVKDRHKIWDSKTGEYYGPDAFRVAFGGYQFQFDQDRGKKTKNAWEAFTESQVLSWPKVDTSAFAPLQPPGSISVVDLRRVVNTYIYVDTPCTPGDPWLFTRHLKKLLPVARDREILTSYLAACVQHKGHKFQWAPIIQGTPGNGKTLLTRCVEHAIGSRYCHRPRSSDIGGKFNGWLADKILIGVEDIKIPESRKDAIDALKPLITNGDGVDIEFKGRDQVNVSICCNFIFNANDQDGIQKTKDDRRFAPFFTAQQCAEDLDRDGMGPAYFSELYGWLDNGGYAIVTHYLRHYQIPVEFNPALQAGGMASRAPETSTTWVAIEQGRDSVAQEIIEAIEEGRVGFCGGFVSSVALSTFLDERHLRAHPRARKAIMESLGYTAHPALPGGRAGRAVAMDGNRRPFLYVLRGHLAEQLRDPGKVVDLYERSQSPNHQNKFDAA